MMKTNRLLNKWSVASLISAILLIFLILRFGVSDSTQSKNDSDNGIRLVSLIPSVTQSLYCLDAQNNLVGCTNYCKTEANDSVEVVSSVIKPNIEKIVSLKPNLVLVSSLISEKDIETFGKFGIKVERFLSPHSFDEVCSEFIRLGKLVGREKKAVEIVAQAKDKVLAIKSGISEDSKPKIFIQIGASPIYAVIPNTFMDDYITFCKGVNIADGLTSGAVGREFVVSKDPDVIFIVTMGIAGEGEVDQWRAFKQMGAVVNNRIFVINSDIACQPTPITFVETLELMNKYINEGNR